MDSLSMAVSFVGIIIVLSSVLSITYTILKYGYYLPESSNVQLLGDSEILSSEQL